MALLSESEAGELLFIRSLLIQQRRLPVNIRRPGGRATRHETPRTPLLWVYPVNSPEGKIVYKSWLWFGKYKKAKCMNVKYIWSDSVPIILRKVDLWCCIFRRCKILNGQLSHKLWGGRRADRLHPPSWVTENIYRAKNIFHVSSAGIESMGFVFIDSLILFSSPPVSRESASSQTDRRLINRRRRC